jgi:hypothetical protein
MRGAYIIGEPGVGKSTAVTALTAGVDTEWRRKPFAHAVYRDDDGRTVAAQIGGPPKAPDHGFPGTDRLSMSVQPRAVEWVGSAPAPMVFGEGDRLASAGFLHALSDYCDEWWLVYLSAPAEVIEARRAERGSQQNETWLQGRRTKTRNLAVQFSRQLVTIDATVPTEAVVAQIRRQVPAFDWTA